MESETKHLSLCLPLSFLVAAVNCKVYDGITVKGDWYRIVDETEEDQLYPPQCFEVVEPNDDPIPFSITCGIYGLFVHTTFAGTIDEAKELGHPEVAQKKKYRMLFSGAR